MLSVLRSRWTWVLGIGLHIVALTTAATTLIQQGESTTDPVPRTGAWMELHEKFLDRTKTGDIDLLFLGDSITQGWGGGGKAVWERFYGPRKAANFGIGGDRTQHVLWRLDHGEVDGIHPKVAVLMIGTNNLGSNPPDEIADGVIAIVKKLREKLPETKVLLLGVCPRDDNPSARRDRIKTINDRIAKLDDDKMVEYLDIGKYFLNDDGTISKDVMPDFLHLSSRGYRIWADAMEPKLWSMLEGK
jgi:lysophospholipase L1-like esterase